MKQSNVGEMTKARQSEPILSIFAMDAVFKHANPTKAQE
jgi:hypothetical protein